jgi:hypothetical protein
MTRRRRQFDASFRLEAAKMVREQGLSVFEGTYDIERFEMPRLAPTAVDIEDGPAHETVLHQK